MMTHLTPFMYTAYWKPDEPYLVYSVNCDDPQKTSGYMQGYWECNHCGEGNHFRFYDDTYAPRYKTKCPTCKREFIAIDDSE